MIPICKHILRLKLIIIKKVYAGKCNNFHDILGFELTCWTSEQTCCCRCMLLPRSSSTWTLLCHADPVTHVHHYLLLSWQAHSTSGTAMLASHNKMWWTTLTKSADTLTSLSLRQSREKSLLLQSYFVVFLVFLSCIFVGAGFLLGRFFLFNLI